MTRYIALTRSVNNGEWFVICVGAEGEARADVDQEAHDTLNAWHESMHSAPSHLEEQKAELNDLVVLTLRQAVNQYPNAVRDYVEVSDFVYCFLPDKTGLKELIERIQ